MKRFQRWFHHLKWWLQPRAPRPKKKVDSPFRAIRWLDRPGIPSKTSTGRQFQVWFRLLFRKPVKKVEQRQNRPILDLIARPPKAGTLNFRQKVRHSWKQALFFFKYIPKPQRDQAGQGIGINFWLTLPKLKGELNPLLFKKALRILLLSVVTVFIATFSLEILLQLSSVVCWYVTKLQPAVVPETDNLILCIGDSFTAGKFSTSSIQPYSKYVEESLNKESEQEWKVMNFSSEYFRTDDLLHGIVRMLQFQRPAFAYITIGMNDFLDPAKVEQTTNADESPFSRAKFFVESWKHLRSFSSLMYVVAIPPRFLLRNAPASDFPLSSSEFSRLLKTSESKQSSAEIPKELFEFLPPGGNVIWNQLQNGAFLSAETGIEYLIKNNPKDPLAHAALAEIRYRFGRHREGDQQIEWLVQRYRTNPDLSSAYAVMHAFPFGHSTSETIDMTVEVLKRFPRNPSFWEMLARMCAVRSQKNFANKAIQRAIDLVPPSNTKWKASLLRTNAEILAESNPEIALQKLLEANSLDQDQEAFERDLRKFGPYFQSPGIEKLVAKSKMSDSHQVQLNSIFTEVMDKNLNYSSRLFEKHLVRLVDLCKKYNTQPVFLSYPLSRPYIDAVLERVVLKTDSPWIDLSIPFEKVLMDPKERQKMMIKGQFTEESSRKIGKWVSEDVLYRIRKKS